MNEEIIEYKLSLLGVKPVILVIPYFGHVSMSYIGTVCLSTNESPIIFSFSTEMGMSLIFLISDVDTFEEGGTQPIIRIKGPHQYPEVYK